MTLSLQRAAVLAAALACGVGVTGFVAPATGGVSLSTAAPNRSPFVTGDANHPASAWRLRQLRRSWGSQHYMVAGTEEDERKNVVVIGNGMVGHKFCEKLTELDGGKRFKVVTFCEEPRAAYNRMRLTEYFKNRDANDLSMAGTYKEGGITSWYEDNNVEVHIGDKATLIDREKKVVLSEQGRAVPYDVAVIATGSYPFVPPTPGVKRPGVFVYRTIEDLEAMIAYQKEHGVTAAAVIGGGLLGLEAAKAMHDLGMATHIIEYAPILMCRQIDADGHAILGGMIESMGLKIHCDARVSAMVGADPDNDASPVAGLSFSNEGWENLDVGMVVVSAGIRPRDEIARASGITVHDRGGIVVDDALCTSDPNVFAIGEVALHGGMIYGLVAPGYSMADTVARNLADSVVDAVELVVTAEAAAASFTGADMSTKLKLMGVDVASFGRYTATGADVKALVWNDPHGGVYRKLVFSADGKRLLGGILVGDASDYSSLLAFTKIDADLPVSPRDLLTPAGGGGAAAPMGIESMPDEMQVCSCNDVSKGRIVDSVKSGECSSVADIKRCTKAGTGCGGCEPQVKALFAHTMASLGQTVTNHLCEHFSYSRQEMFDIIKVNKYTSFDQVLAAHGSGDGCEVCKPAVASILASLWNEHVLASGNLALQDTNDRALANMQRGGSYSVVPRVAGGEITPAGLIAIGQVAEEYGLYTKITGGQRIDLFGAEKHQLPDIWGKLGAAGFESGHAYGKALRTVKSCVGSTWCRYGMRDAVGFAIEVENRYKGLRSPHKLKGAVSGCIRECAEAQCKDFGLIATETGYNLYVCGNGGAQPKHGELLAAGIDEETCIKYIDRFLMYYVATADRLERTARWFERLEGGIEYLKDVVVHDKLGLAATLEAQMQTIVDTYQDEWATALADPALRKSFKQFVNSDENERGIAFIPQRDMARPMDWPKDEDIPKLDARAEGAAALSGEAAWVRVGVADDFPLDGGATIKYGKSQIAVYRLAGRNGGEWYATQNVCPHKRALVLSQGLVGSRAGEPKVACPLHKKNFSLKSGDCLDEPELSLLTFPVEVRGADASVYLKLPPAVELDRVLATDKVMMGGSDCASGCSSGGGGGNAVNGVVTFGKSGSSMAATGGAAVAPGVAVAAAPAGEL